jgi:predicted amidohydrolase
MTETFKAACIQNCATPDVDHDIDVLTHLTGDAAARGATLIALPEYCAGLDTKDGKLFPVAYSESEHPVIPAMAQLARQHRAWILIGSIGIKANDGRIFNRSLMLDPQGAIAARYDKLHMFDVDGFQFAMTCALPLSIAAWQRRVPASSPFLLPSPGSPVKRTGMC